MERLSVVGGFSPFTYGVLSGSETEKELGI